MNARCCLSLALVLAAAGVADAQNRPAAAAGEPRLRAQVELRERAESLGAAGFAGGRDDLFWLTRVRLGATLAPAPLVRFFGQVQDARVADKSVGPLTAPFSAPFDLRQAYGELGTARTAIAIRAGRQELVFGDQRLLGHLNWTNAARVFDAVRGTWRPRRWQVDLFESSVVRSLHDAFDRSGAGSRLAGVYGTSTTLLPSVSLEPYLLWRRERSQRNEAGAAGRLSAATLGVRLSRQLPAPFEWAVEMALQRGASAGDPVRAWAAHWRVRRATGLRGDLRLSAEFNAASGDRDPQDGVRGTFDQLFPTGHDKYGLADVVGWKNIRHLRFGADLTPVRGLPIVVNYHSWWLADVNDALYSAGSAVVARLPATHQAGDEPRHVGQEIDVQLSRAFGRQLLLAGGLAHVIPGAFLQIATPGAAHTFGYVQVSVAFTAAR